MVSYDSSDEDYNDAAKHAGITLVDTDKDRVDAVVAKARALYNAGDFDAARIAFLQAQEYEPLAPGRWKHANNASACMLRSGDNEATLDYTKRVLAVRFAIARLPNPGITSARDVRIRCCLPGTAYVLLLYPACCYTR